MLVELHHNIVYDDAVSALREGGFEIVSEDRRDRLELCCRRQAVTQPVVRGALES